MCLLIWFVLGDPGRFYGMNIDLTEGNKDSMEAKTESRIMGTPSGNALRNGDTSSVCL